MLALGYVDLLHREIIDISVAVRTRQHRCTELIDILAEPRIGGDQPLLQRRAALAPVAIETAYRGEIAVQVDYRLVAGALMQVVDILRYQLFNKSTLLQLSQGQVRLIRLSVGDSLPAKHATGPVALAL